MLKDIKRIKRTIGKAIRRKRGDIFQNQGVFAAADFEVIRKGIDEVRPKTFIELGTGEGTATEMIFRYLEKYYSECEFWTIEIFRPLAEAVQTRFGANPKFHAVWGLTVTPEETTDPARSELVSYTGPIDRLRKILDQIVGQGVDMALIDSRKGSSLAEFKLLEQRLSPGGIIYCHDILNRGKGVEALMYLQQHKDRFDYDIFDTSPEGIIRIKIKA
jgi:hypothetical protein